MLRIPCLTAVDGFSFPDLTCALARCKEDASNWAAFIYNTSCSTCLERKRGKKRIYVSKDLSWTHSSHGQAALFNHNPTQGPVAAAKEDRCLKCNSTLPFTNALSQVESTSAPAGAAAANTNCFNADTLKRNIYLWGLTVRGQHLTTSDWVYFSHSVISYAPGILSCEKQTLCRWFVILCFFAGRRQEVELPFPTTPNFSYFSLLLMLLIDSTKKGQIWTQSPPSQPQPQCYRFSPASRNKRGLRPDRTWNTSSRLRNALLLLQPKLLTIFPNFCARTENTVLFFVC